MVESSGEEVRPAKSPREQRQGAIAEEFRRRRKRRRRARQVRSAGITAVLAALGAVVVYSSGLWPIGLWPGGGASPAVHRHVAASLGHSGPKVTTPTSSAALGSSTTTPRTTTSGTTTSRASTSGATTASGATASGALSTTSSTSPSTATTTPTTSTTASATSAPATPAEPRGGSTLIPGYRIVAFYGVPNDPALGVLGEAPPAALWPRLAQQASAYATPGIRALPAYELTAFTAQGLPGPSGTYSARTSNKVISSYLSVVKAHHGLLILDIQPGRSSFLADAKTLAPFLAQPDVALALDPQWKLSATQYPGAQLGETSADSINAVSAWLSHFDAVHHLPQKLLLIHQFTQNVIEDSSAVLHRSNLAIVFCMDGFGPPAVKAAAYKQFSSQYKFPLGMRLFYQYDTPLLDPSQVVALRPAPALVEYQ